MTDKPLSEEELNALAEKLPVHMKQLRMDVIVIPDDQFRRLITQARRSIPSEEGVEGSPEASGPSVDVTSSGSDALDDPPSRDLELGPEDNLAEEIWP